MKLITRDTDYAIRALAFIVGSKEEVVSVTSLVKALKIPRPFLRKTLQQLTRKGILASQKGKGGGFILLRSPQKIYLLDLIRIFQGPVILNECVFRKKLCPNRNTCPLKKKIDLIEDHVVNELSSIKVSDLIKG